MRINSRIGYLQDWITQVWVKLTGRQFAPDKSEWLVGPIGDTDIIKDKFIETLAQNDNLQIERNGINAGLLTSFHDLELSEDELKLLHPKIVDFYEKTSNYGFEICSEWCGFFKPFGWILSVMTKTRKLFLKSDRRADLVFSKCPAIIRK